MELTLKEIADHIGADLIDCEDPNQIISMIMPIEAASPNTVSFISSDKYTKYLAESDAAALICSPSMRDKPHKAALLLHESPYVGFAKLMQKWFNVEPEWDGVHERAVIDPSAKIGEKVSIGANCVVGKGATVGEHVKLHPGVVIGDGVSIGNNTTIYPNVTVYHGCVIGNKVIIHSGAVIGADGFGFAPNPKEGRHEKIPQIGNVVIEDDVEIGANTTIDRAVLGQTRIGTGTKIDNLVQIAHNVQVGRGCFIVSQVGVSGSSKLGNFVTLAGQVGVIGHLNIGDQVVVGAQSGVTSDIKAGSKILGSPAIDGKQTLRVWGVTKRLPALRKQVRNLQKQVDALTKANTPPE